MLVLILVSLLFSVCCSKANTGSSSLTKTCQQGNFCISLREGEITAEAGLCAVIPCLFSTDSTFKTTKIIWSHKEKTNKGYAVIFNSSDRSKVAKTEVKDRVSLLESDVSRGNCSIIINDLRESDSGFYQLRVEGTSGFSFIQNTASLSVTDLTQKPTVMVPPLTEGQQATLSCTAPGLCSGSAPEITWMWRGGGQNESSITGNTDTEKLSAIEQRHSSTLTFTPSAEHHGNNIICKVGFKNNISTEKTETLNVSYVKDPVIRGERAVKPGDALNLSCSADSFPPSVVTWTKLGSNKTLKEDSRTAELIIPSMTAEDVGKYICTASHQITNRRARTEVTQRVKPRILNSSACELQSEVLTCVCVSQGFPLPTIEWPLLRNRTHYSLTTSVSKNTVSFVTASVKDLNYTTVTCVSRNEFGEFKEDLEVGMKSVTKKEMEEEEEITVKLLDSLKQPQVLVAFLIGLLLSAVVCCSVLKCHRKNQKSSGNMSLETLEMMGVDPALVNEGRHDQDRAEGGADAEADAEPREVEYSDINFDLLKRGRPAGAEGSQETSEYAEIKKDKTKREQENDGEDGEVMEGNQEEERNDHLAEKEEEEALYSNVKDLMKEV